MSQQCGYPSRHAFSQTRERPKPGAHDIMESVTTVALTLMAVLVGMIVVVLLQLHHALRQLRMEVREARQRLEPMFDKLNSTSQVATSVAMAVAAGVRAYRDAKNEAAAAAPPIPSGHEAHTARTHTTTRTTDQYEEAFR
jgi:hypothetical protein